MIPAFAVQFRPVGVHPQFPRRGQSAGVFAESIGRTEPQFILEPSVTGLAAFAPHPIERAFEATGRRTVVGAPVGKPDWARVGAIHGCDDEVHAGFRVFVTGNGTSSNRSALGIARVVLREGWVALSVRLDHPAEDAKAAAFGIQVLAVSRLSPIGDNALNVPFVGIQQESHERLLVVRITAGVRFDDVADTVLMARGSSPDRPAVDLESNTCQEGKQPNTANVFLARSINHAFRSLNGGPNQVNRSIPANSSRHLTFSS